jgi:rhodanese-related sulfurtransferase
MSSDITPAEALAAAERGEVLLLDVREQHEWDAGHAAGALHLPLGRLHPDAVPQDRPVVTVCHLGGRSSMAAQALAGVGYDVRNLAGGMEAWAQAGLPVVRDDGSPGEIV